MKFYRRQKQVFISSRIKHDMQDKKRHKNSILKNKKDNMKNIKKYCSSLFLALLTSNISLLSYGMFESSDSFDQALESFEQQTDLVRDSQTPIDPCIIIPLLIAVKATDLLAEDLYLRTNGINKRSILDYPHWVLAQQQEGFYKWTVGSHIFYNQTTRSNFTSNSSCIKDYLAINNPDLIDKISNSIDKIRPLLPGFDINPLDILPLFHPFTVQERRTGLMLHCMRDFANTRMRFYFPLYYVEHNFYVDDQTKLKLEQELGTLDTETQAEFQKDHLVSDKLGIGDFRFELEFPVFEREHFFARVGGRVTVPTAVAFSNGIMGSNFNKCCPRPRFSFSEIFAPFLNDDETPAEKKEEATEVLQRFMLGALDHLAANILETKLGNGGHFGLGGYAYSDLVLQKIIHRPWAEYVVWRNKAILEYLLPNTQTRYFINKKNLNAFATRDFENESKCAENLAFLDQRIVDQFYPLALQATVLPGIMFNWVTELQYNGTHFRPAIGADLWFQAPEQIYNIQGHEQRMNQLDLVRAKAPMAYQAKIFGTLGGVIQRAKRDWFVSVNGDYTILSSGIGKDFTITFNFEANF